MKTTRSCKAAARYDLVMRVGSIGVARSCRPRPRKNKPWNNTKIFRTAKNGVRVAYADAGARPASREQLAVSIEAASDKAARQEV